MPSTKPLHETSVLEEIEIVNGCGSKIVWLKFIEQLLSSVMVMA